MTKTKLFTSESVTEGHPDKVCDQISDSILDAIMEKDPNARVACETAVNTGLVLVMGEISTDCYVDIPSVVRNTVRDIGYTRAKYGFDADTCAVLQSIDEQSTDIAQGVNDAMETRQSDVHQNGAGDQGMMFGFACRETESYMPMPIHLAHTMSKKLAEVRKNNTLDWLRPDGKTQVTIKYDDDKPVAVDTVVVSCQHSENVELPEIKKEIIKNVIEPCLPQNLDVSNIKYLINPTGRFVIGGPMGDSGLTGRKIIVDTYGGYAKHGGVAFSGKDCTKVDRSAAYAARWVAKHMVAAGLCEKCEIEIAYAIGVAEPVSLLVDTFGTGKLPENEIENIIHQVFDLRPSAIITELDLRRPIYKQTASYGHFGRDDLNLPWEQLSKLDLVKKAAKI